MKARTAALVFLALLVVAVVVIVVLPASDPLGDAETVYLDLMGREEDSGTAATIQEQLRVVLNERNLQIVADRERADVALAISAIDLNLGDVEFSVSRGELAGQAKAVLKTTDLRTGREHTMDLIVRVRDGRISASLKARKFYEFWK